MTFRAFLNYSTSGILAAVLATVLTAPFSASAQDAGGSGDAAGSVTLVAGRIVRPDGTLDDGVAIVVRDGKIKRLVAAKTVRGPEVRRFDPQTVICPGLIDLFSSIGVGGQTIETTSFVDPDASAADSLDSSHRDFGNAIRAGITAAMVTPAPRNLVNGVAVTFRTFVDNGGQLDVLRDDGPLVFAFGDGVWRQDRAPTSQAGALNELRSLVEQARQGNGHPRTCAAVAGRLDALFVCDSANDLYAVRGALGDAAGRFGIVHTRDAIEVAADLKGLERPVVAGPYGFTSSRRSLLGPAALSEAGVEVAFPGGFPQASPDSLRITAALAVRHGMGAAAARRAITIAPAQTAGVADSIGSIVPGRDGDLVVFSNDPLRLDAVVLEVYVKGVRVYAAKNQESAREGAKR